jgi:hypothetical protein
MRALLRPLVPVVFLISLLTLLVFPAFAQETTGRLEGRVLDPQGQPVVDVGVEVSGPSLQGLRAVLSNRQGLFVVLALPVGNYTVKVSHVSFKPQTFEEVRVKLGQTTSLGDVQLHEQAYVLPTMVVKAPPVFLDPASTSVGADLATKDYAALPIERDYRSVVTLVSQVNASFHGDPANFAGSTGSENRYFIDGVDVTDPVYGTYGMALPYNFVREVEVRTGGYAAEYRSSMGGTLNAVTYSGGNEVSGQVFGFFTNGGLKAEPRLSFQDMPEQDYSNYDVGFGVGGPIRKDHLWYYAAYNPTLRRRDVDVPGQGMQEDRTTTHSFAGKLTWRANQKNSFAFSALGDPIDQQAVSVPVPWAVGDVSPIAATLDPILTDVRNGGVNLVLEGRHFLRDDLVLETSLSRAGRMDRIIPATEGAQGEVLFYDYESGIISGAPGSRYDNRTTTWVGGAKATWLTGDHEIKAGAEYKNAHWDIDQVSSFIIRFSDSDFQSWVFSVKGIVGTRVPSLFLQDAWRLTDRLRVNVGVRWAGEYIISSEEEVAQTILDEWQPRVGFAYELGSSRAHKLSATAGRFYQELPTLPLTSYYNSGSLWAYYYYDHDPRLNPTALDSIYIPGHIQEEIDGLKGQCIDEFTLGYERLIGARAKLGLRGIYRTLMQGLEDGLDSVSGEFQFNNPGRGLLAAFPEQERDYTALEVTWEQKGQDRWALRGSYILSRTYGNYPGPYNSDWAIGAYPNINASYDVIEMLTNGEGLLPNDRPHVFKLSGYYQLTRDFSLGGFGFWQSGTPISEFGTLPDYPTNIFLTQRGTVGRTPSLWDLNLRLAYLTPVAPGNRWRPKLTVDLLHVASQRKAVAVAQYHYLRAEELPNGEIQQVDPNPNYLKPTAYQPPMEVRVGVEMQF